MSKDENEKWKRERMNWKQHLMNELKDEWIIRETENCDDGPNY